ncbi:MAG: HAD family hydrolase [Anaerolineae bacterium]|nr:HAD family hydrolase [Anaerolineae bacterium]
MLSWSTKSTPSSQWETGFRMVGIDLDGLIQPRETLHSADAAAIRTAYANGAKVVLMSSRAPQGMHRYWAQLGLGTPVIAFNGALVFDYPGHKILAGQPLSVETINQVLKLLRDIAPKAGVGLDLSNSWAVNRLGKVAEWTIARTGTWPANVGNLRSALDEPVFQMWIDAEPEALERLMDAVDLPGVTKMRYTNPDRVLLRSAAGTRSWAIATTAALLDVPSHQVLVIGDGGLDRSLLQVAAFALIAKEGEPPIELPKDTEKPVIVAHGVAEALERYVQVTPPPLSVLALEESNEFPWRSSEL